MRNLPAIEQQLSMLGWFSSDHVGILAMGLFYGLTLCSFSCLPMLAPYLFANAMQTNGRSGFMPAFNLTALFIIARVVTYAVLGAVAGATGETLLARLDEGMLMPVAGGIVVAIGIAVIFSRKSSCAKPAARPVRRSGLKGTAHMLGLGMATSLMPCLPLTAVLMLAAVRGSVTEGALYGFLFGLGAAASPLYYIGGAAGWLATRIRQEIPKHAALLRRINGVILVLFGARLIVSWTMT